MKISNQQSAFSNRLWLVVPTLLFALAVWLDLTPWLRGPDEWRWTLRSTTSPERMLVPLIILGLYAMVCGRWLGRSGVASKRFLAFVTLAAPIIQLALAFAVSRQPLLQFFGPTVSIHNSGYFSTAVASPDLASLLTRFPALMPTLPIHAQSHPPGPIMLQWAGWQFFQAWPALADSIALPLRTLQCHNPGLMALDNPQIASASIGMLLPLIGALAVWPMFAFGKRVVGAKAALLAAALFPVMPLFAMWPSQWDQIYPLLLFSGLYLAHTGLEARSRWRLLAAGVPLSIATFFSVGNSVLIAIVGLYGVAWIALNPESGKQIKLRRLVSAWLKWIVVFALGGASIWIAYALIYRTNPLDVLSTGSRLAWESTTSGRSYGLWLAWDPIDFATFLGIPIVLLLLLNLRKILKLSRNLWPLMIATFVTLIFLDLAGIVRGEVGRLWIYFGPLVMLVAVAGSEEQAPPNSCATRSTQPVLLVGLLALQLLVMNTRWLVNDSFLDEPPARTPNFVPPNPSIAAQAAFDRQIALRGYDASVLPGTFSLTLYWQALAQPPHAYTVFVHVLDSNGQQVGQQDNMPVNNQSITSCWQPGEFVVDPYSITLQAGALGPFTLEVGLYRVDTAERLRLDDGSGTSLRLKGP